MRSSTSATASGATAEQIAGNIPLALIIHALTPYAVGTDVEGLT